VFTVKSKLFVKQLQAMRERLHGANRLAFRIVVPPEMAWWYWQEFGTALYAERETSNPTGYTIKPKAGVALKFFDRGSGEFRFANEVFVYGIPAKHIVEESIPEIHIVVKHDAIQAFKQSGYNPHEMRDILLNNMMPKIKEIIKLAYEVKLSNTPRPGGRLEGTTAADEFEAKAVIEDLST
jgi:hypothetical protein